MKRLPRECVYCGATEGLTRDHVPGRGLFSAPLPSDLVTVPCCEDHNIEYSREDEYFRLVVASRQESSGHIEAAQASNRAFARLVRPEARGLDAAFRESLAHLEPAPDHGDGTGFRAVSIVDFGRLNRYAERTVKALFAHHWRFRLPDDFEVKMMVLDCLDFGQPRNQNLLNNFIATLEPRKQHSSARAILRYKYKCYEENGISSAWMLSFFFYTAFIGGIVPRAPMPNPAAEPGGFAAG